MCVRVACVDKLHSLRFHQHHSFLSRSRVGYHHHRFSLKTLSRNHESCIIGCRWRNRTAACSALEGQPLGLAPVSLRSRQCSRCGRRSVPHQHQKQGTELVSMPSQVVNSVFHVGDGAFGRYEGCVERSVTCLS